MARLVTSPLPHPIIPNVSANSFLLDTLQRHGKKEIFIDCPSGRLWTGDQISRAALGFAASLIQEIKVSRGDVIAFYVANSDFHAIAYLGVLAAGAIYIGCDHYNPYREIYNAVCDSDAKYLVCSETNYEIALQVMQNAASLKNVLVLSETYERPDNIPATIICINPWFRNHCPSDMELPLSLKPDDIVALQLSSGSTGKPKMIIRTSANFMHTSLTSQHQEMLGTNDQNSVTLGNTFTHCSGLIMLLHCIIGGTKLAIMRESFDTENFLLFTEQYKISRAFLVPSYIYFLTKNENVKKYNLSSLKHIIHGGAPLVESAIDDLEKILNLESIRPCFGATEIIWGTLLPKSEANANRKVKTCGSPIPGVVIKIADLETNVMLGPGEIGEIRFKGKQITPGYYNNPSANADLFDSDGFLRSGDSGYFDGDNLIYVVGRYKDIIKFNSNVVVSPGEIETVLMDYEHVSEVAVIGVPHELHYEVPRAFIVLNHKPITEDDICRFVAERLDPAKHLKGGVKFLDRLPRSAMGKIQKSALKEL